MFLRADVYAYTPHLVLHSPIDQIHNRNESIVYLSKIYQNTRHHKHKHTSLSQNAYL